MLTSLFAVGYAIGPMLGGYLSEHYGDAMPAVPTCLLFLSLIPATVFLLPETNALVTGRGGADGGGGGGMQGGRAGAPPHGVAYSNEVRVLARGELFVE